MTTIIANTIIATVDDEDRVLADAAIAIEGGRIAALGPTAEVLPRFPDAEVVDGRRHMVMPGFANTHTHFSLTIARGVYEDLSPPHKPPFYSGLSPVPVPDLSAEENALMCTLGAVEAIRSGTTLVLEDGARIATYAPLMAQSGLRYVLAERAWDKAKGSIGDQLPFEVSEKLADDGMTRISDLHARWHGKEGGRIAVGIAAWAPDMCSPGLLRRLTDLQSSLDALSTIHLNQIWGEVEAVKAIRGRLPTEYLADNGFLNRRVVCAHCRCMTCEEERLLGSTGATVAFNSAIAARRGLSPRIHDLEQYGCTIAMGSDNMAEDMVEVMRTGLFMERVRREDGRNPTPEQALRWATRNGYAALGVPDGGWLAEGNRADLIMVRLGRAHLVPLVRPVSTFVHQGQAADVDAVMVDGAWVMRDGRILTLDEEDVVSRADTAGRRAWQRLRDQRPDLPWPKGFI
ncbi:amidohydrolase family protein [Elioraea rosea]|uniref:amidohydrolase family protein n=1 Tax=Elioraea rosea TaxID=2492390 RepID=UPI0013151DB4|nr:amidohydrolase family protein [Elioraea rosea]